MEKITPVMQRNKSKEHNIQQLGGCSLEAARLMPGHAANHVSWVQIHVQEKVTSEYNGYRHQ